MSPEEAGEAADPLVWSSVELPCGGPMGALIVSSVQNPGEFYCVRSEPEGTVVWVVRWLMLLVEDCWGKGHAGTCQ
jgi:hypothetical protein